MKKIILLLLINITAVFGQKNIKVVSKIDNVTVYQNKAQIEANASFAVNPGVSKVIIEDISSTIDQNSIQVNGKGDFTLLGIKYSTNFLNKKTNQLKDSLDLLQIEIENLEMILNVAVNEEKMIMANSDIKSTTEGLIPEDFKEMIDVFRTKLTEIGTRKMALKRQQKEIQKHIERINNQINLNNTNNLPSGQIELTVSAKSAHYAQIVLNYIVNNVGWYPSYDLRIKDDKSPVNLLYKANVYQNTGIDWADVKLTLSTSNPTLSGNKPELNPLYLSIFEPQIMPVASRAMKSEVMMNDMAPMALESIQSSANSVVVSETSLAVLFSISQKYSIPSGGNPELVDIQQFEIPASYSYYAVPKFENDAFLTAEILNWEKYNILPGEANVYFEGRFIGNSSLGGINTEDKLLISLGRDKKIISKREELQDFKSRKNIGSSVKENISYKITLRNTKSESSKLVVEDQIPVSQDSNIEVTIDENSGAIFDETTGKLKWTVSLNPNESKELKFNYTVKYPKDKKVINL